MIYRLDFGCTYFELNADLEFNLSNDPDFENFFVFYDVDTFAK
jgi:hypothetical protein